MDRFSDAALDQLSTEGDPLADAVLAAHAAERPDVEPRRLVAEIGRHLVLPPEQGSPAITVYLQQRPPLPPWVDHELLRTGASWFGERGLEICTALLCASLPESYAGARGARILGMTTRLVSDPVRRVMETAQLLFDVNAPDGLAPGGVGYDAARRVRLMHAAVRYLVEHDPAFVPADDGSPDRPERPVNQEDLLGVLLTFTTVVFGCLDRQGIGCRDDDARAYLHLFCVVAALLGLREDLLPLTLDEAEELTPRLFGRLQRASDDGAALTAALVGAIRATLRFRALRGLPASSIRWYVGDDVAAMLGLPRKDWTWLLFGPFHRCLRALGQDERHSALVRRLDRQVTAAVLRQVETANRGDRPPFQLPRQLAERAHNAPSRWTI